MKLKGVLAPVVASGGFRVIIIDCPPALGMLFDEQPSGRVFEFVMFVCEVFFGVCLKSFELPLLNLLNVWSLEL